MEAQIAAAIQVAMSLQLLIMRLLAHLTREVGRPIYSSLECWPPYQIRLHRLVPLLVQERALQGVNEEMF
jgi:hypothetical protein